MTGLGVFAAVPYLREAIARAAQVEQDDVRELALGVHPDDPGLDVIAVIGGIAYAAGGREGVVMACGSRWLVWLNGEDRPRRVRSWGVIA